MKKTDLLKEIKTMDTKALIERSKVLKVDIASLIMDMNMNKIKDLKSVSKKKKELARVLTVLGQKQNIEKLESRSMNQESSEKKVLKGALA